LKKVYFKTFGCRTNIFDSHLMASKLKNYSETKSEEDADIIVINSCTVTDSADSSLKQYINRVKKKGKPIYLSGCKVPSSSQNELMEYGVNGVFDSGAKEKIDDLLQKPSFFIQKDGLEHIDESIVERFEGRSRAFIKIQEGCDFACSYCIIPSVRGKARSLREETILKQIETVASNGYSEVVLTGTNVGSYGIDSGTNLGELIEKIGGIEGIKRVRLGSVEPSQTEQLLPVLEAPYFAKQLHIALQHTSDKILEIMNRKNRFETDLKLFETLSKKGFALGTDFLIGHPGEDEQIWRSAIDRVKMLPLTHIHTFSFSPRAGTPSAKMKNDTNQKVIKERQQELEALIKEKNYIFRSQKEPLAVLCETKKGDFFSGYDQFFNRVFVKSEKNLNKKWITIENYEAEYEKNIAYLE